jgi:hypothetical protein
MRRMRKRRGKSTEKKSPILLTGSSQKGSLSLEKRVRSLESRVDFLELQLGIDAFPEKIQKKPGPEPKIPAEELLENRDALVDWLEICWLELGPRLLCATRAEEITAALEPHVLPETGRSRIIKRLMDNAAALLSFLHSTRFHRKPSKQAVIDALNQPWDDDKRMRAAAKLPTRQIANAMAGVPKLEWRTSLDRCLRKPSQLAVGKKTEDHYRELYGVPLPKKRRAQAKP